MHWLAGCLFVILTGKFHLQLISQCGNTSNCLSRSVSEIHVTCRRDGKNKEGMKQTRPRCAATIFCGFQFFRNFFLMAGFIALLLSASTTLRRELSPARTLEFPGRNRVQITWNTSSAYHMQRVVCLLVRRDISAIKFDRVGISFI